MGVSIPATGNSVSQIWFKCFLTKDAALMIAVSKNWFLNCDSTSSDKIKILGTAYCIRKNKKQLEAIYNKESHRLHAFNHKKTEIGFY